MKKKRNRACLPIAVFALFIGVTNFANANEKADYRLAIGDTVRVTVYGHEDLSGEFEVDGSGRISLPLIQDVAAEGRSLQELEEIITAELSPDYLKAPSVSAEVLNYRPFYIIGEISKPGSYPYVNGMTVINAVAFAGGFTYRARKGHIRIVRESDDGSTLEFKVSNGTVVLPGDVIEVPERFF